MPRNDKCTHPRCDGGPCKALTDEELTPTTEDHELAERLLAEGWIQVSSKGRILRRWKPPGPPPPIVFLTPEILATRWGELAAAAISRHVTSYSGLHQEHDRLYQEGVPCGVPNPLVEERTLTMREFKAYKAAQRARERHARPVFRSEFNQKPVPVSE